MTKKPKQNELIIQGERVVIRPIDIKCFAFEFCFQPDICERFDDCIWKPRKDDGEKSPND